MPSTSPTPSSPNSPRSPRLRDDEESTAHASRDWWPLALHWALAGEVPCRGAAVVRPATTDQVAAVAALCHRAHVPLTVAAGRSGVSGAAVPAFGGIVVDLTGLQGVVAVDRESGVVEVAAGTFGPDLEAELANAGLSVGHYPQSFHLATVGGWIACRGAGQYSTRYGNIEDLVVGLEVVLADGRIVRTGGAPAAAAGPDLNQLFIGSEGTLGIVTRAWLGPIAYPPRNAVPPTTSRRSPTGSRLAGRSCAAVQRRPCCGSTTSSSRSEEVARATARTPR